MAKEKTKADLLSEINSDLEKRNKELLDELRNLKSNATMLEAAKVKLDKFNELQEENKNFKDLIANLQKQNQIQARQIEVLIQGLNGVNESVSKHFDYLKYSINLARQDYEKAFTIIQSELNRIQDENKEKE